MKPFAEHCPCFGHGLNVLLPPKMMVGSFPDLFGTALGKALQAWCKKQGW